MDRPEAGVGHHWQCHSALPLCRRGGADVAIEAIGLPATQEEAVASLRTGGRAVLLGSSAEPMTLQSGRLMYRELSVLGTLGCRPADFPAVLDLVRRGRLASRRS